MPVPNPPINWKAPWYLLEVSEHQQGIQKELTLEIGPLHPLWETSPIALGKRENSDDIVVDLNDGRFAIVHLVWHGHIDQVPDRFPATTFFENLASLQNEIDSESERWTDE
jgi:hypothetical protein